VLAFTNTPFPVLSETEVKLPPTYKVLVLESTANARTLSSASKANRPNSISSGEGKVGLAQEKTKVIKSRKGRQKGEVQDFLIISIFMNYNIFGDFQTYYIFLIE